MKRSFMSNQIKVCRVFSDCRQKPAVKRFSQLLINRVAVMRAEHRKGLAYTAVDLTAAAVGQIIERNAPVSLEDL